MTKTACIPLILAALFAAKCSGERKTAVAMVDSRFQGRVNAECPHLNFSVPAFFNPYLAE